MRIGIFFGGPSREREVSFAGGRTVYDNLDKDIFEAIPIFVDSLGQFIKLDWTNIYKGTIRDFYPPAQLIPEGHEGQHYIDSFPEIAEKSAEAVGQLMSINQIAREIDFAFLALHGRYGEDGVIQAQLENVGLPYSGSGILASAMGMDKYAQKKIMAASGFQMPKMQVIYRDQWLSDPSHVISELQSQFSSKLVIRPARQGSSIGVSILDKAEKQSLTNALNLAFFRQEISISEWKTQSEDSRQNFIHTLADVKMNLGFPLLYDGHKCFTTNEVTRRLDSEGTEKTIVLEALDSEQTVIAESFISGREFSCIVVRNLDDKSLALPPTEIVKQGQLYDYRSKYLPGLSRKETPIQLPSDIIQSIREECCRLFDLMDFGCYARIDGFYTSDGDIVLNDPNTTSGMLPSSFFFHQAAEVGLNPSQFLTYIIFTSIRERIRSSTMVNDFEKWIQYIDQKLSALRSENDTKIKVGVIFGGYSFERHISVESGRNIYEKLASSSKYQPIPIFLKGNEKAYKLYEVPINLLLKDNADDIAEKIEKNDSHPLISSIRNEAKAITDKFAGQATFEPLEIALADLETRYDAVFIALHGRPGEDGNIQSHLEKMGMPYNGSNAASSSITINKFDTLQLLGSHQLPTTDQWVIEKADFQYAPERWIESVEGKFGFPLIAKPVDDGCSSAVVKIKNEQHLHDYLTALFRKEDELSEKLRNALHLSWNEEFPKKNEVLIEALIDQNDDLLFMEITCGLITELNDNKIDIQVFEPSEALASGDVLSLEEKFLAGQGLNITPARFDVNGLEYSFVAEKVKADLKKAAEILGIEGYARIDAFVRVKKDLTVETIIIEVNSLPGMTPATCIYHQAALEGMKPYDFIDKILTFAMKRQKMIEA